MILKTVGPLITIDTAASNVHVLSHVQLSMWHLKKFKMTINPYDSTYSLLNAEVMAYWRRV